MRDGTETIGVQSREITLFKDCLAAGRGMIPDSAGDWYSVVAIAYIFGCEPGTVQNKIYKLRKQGATIDEHPFGKYYQLDQIREAKPDVKENPKPKARKRRR